MFKTILYLIEKFMSSIKGRKVDCLNSNCDLLLKRSLVAEGTASLRKPFFLR